MHEEKMRPQKLFAEKPMWIYLAVAYGVPFLMMIPLAICQRSGGDTTTFATAQMMYPAAGVMLGLLVQKDRPMPVRFFVAYLITALGCLVLSIASAVAPDPTWYLYANLLLIVGSVVAGILLLTDKKEKRAACGLRGGRWGLSLALVLLFIALYTVRIALSVALNGGMAEFLAYMQTSAPWILLAMLPVNYFLVFIAFFGEEYGWRYYLQPRLQQRFGPRLGVLVLGIVWGLWHMPLNLFFYSPETSLASMAAQQVTCIGLSVFMAFAYMKTKNIWVPVLIHYFNNNLIPVFTGTAELSNQVYTWGDIVQSVLVTGLVFLPFLLAPIFKNKAAQDAINALNPAPETLAPVAEQTVQGEQE